MVDPNKLLPNVLPFTEEPNAIDGLERLRASYKGMSERDALTGADQAVLAAVEITLKHLARTLWGDGERRDKPAHCRG